MPNGDFHAQLLLRQSEFLDDGQLGAGEHQALERKRRGPGHVEFAASRNGLFVGAFRLLRVGLRLHVRRNQQAATDATHHTISNDARTQRVQNQRHTGSLWQNRAACSSCSCWSPT